MNRFYGWFGVCLAKRYSQEQPTFLVHDLNHKVLLLVRRQTFPVRNDLHKDIRDPPSDALSRINIGKVQGRRIPDTTGLIIEK